MKTILVCGGNHVSLAAQRLVVVALVYGELKIALVPTYTAVAAGLILHPHGPFRLEGEFPEIDGGDDCEGTPSPAKEAEFTARMTICGMAEWLPLCAGFGGGDKTPSIPAWAVIEHLSQ